MSFIATIAGTAYTLPTEGDNNWGQPTSSWMAAVSTELLQRTGGLFALSAEVDFGANFATVQAYLKSRTANIASAEFIRMARTDAIAWRNEANDGNLLLAVNSSNLLTFDGNVILTAPGGALSPSQGGTGISTYAIGDILYATATTTLAKRAIGAANTVLQSNGTHPIYGLLVNANIDPAAAIERSKIAVGTADHVLINAGDGAMSSEAQLAITRGGTGQATANAGFAALSPMTTEGDLITRNGTVPVRLSVGAAGTVLQSNGTTPVYASVGVPTGVINPFAGTTAPTGWLACDGSAVSRATYAALYSVIGDAYGEGDGSTTFNLPDLRGRFLRGVDGATGRDPNAATRTASNTGGNTGDNVGSVQADAMQGHWHNLNTTASALASGGSFSRLNPAGSADNNVVRDPVTDGVNGTPRTSSETRPINVYVNFIIKI